MSKKPKASKKPAVRNAPVPEVTAVEAAAPYRCAGYNEEGIDRYISAAEHKDRGTTRFPWAEDLKAQIKANLNGVRTEEDMRDTLNKTVLDTVGGGFHNAGPIDGGPYGRGPARILGI